MILYKYFHEERLENVLQDHLVRLTQPGSLNDPFDGGPVVVWQTKEDIEALPKERELEDGRSVRLITPEFLQTILAHALPMIQSQGVGNESAHILDPYEAFRTELDTKFGVFSLSERHDSLLMWSHYANEHRGFVIEIDTKFDFFEGPEIWPGLQRLSKIEYSERRPVLSLIGPKPPSVLIRKSPEWALESEWRLIRPLKEADKFLKPDAKGLEIALFKLPPNSIKRVFFGMRMAQANIEKAHRIIRSKSTGANISAHYMKRDDLNFALVTDPPLTEEARQLAINGKALYAPRSQD